MLTTYKSTQNIAVYIIIIYTCSSAWLFVLKHIVYVK